MISRLIILFQIELVNGRLHVRGFITASLAIILFATQANASIIYQSVDLTTYSNDNFCSPCDNDPRWTGSAFTLLSPTKIDRIELSVFIGFTHEHYIDVRIYERNNSRSGADIGRTYYDGSGLVDSYTQIGPNNWLASFPVSTWQLPAGNYFIFLSDVNEYKISRFQTGDRQAVRVASRPGYNSLYGLSTTLADNETVGYRLISGGGHFGPGAFAVAAAIPEPANWALLIGGFALLGATARRTHYTRAKLLR